MHILFFACILSVLINQNLNSTEHLQSTINRQISHTKKEKRLSSFDYNGTC